MRDFNDADRKKKKTRIKLKANPGNLTPAEMTKLEDMVKKSLKDGYLPCPVAFKIAREARVPGISIGEVTDRLGVRITNCQIGCFKVEKTASKGKPGNNLDEKLPGILEDLSKNEELTCARVFSLAREYKCAPMAVADIANNRKLQIHQCQLGCF